MPQTRGQDKRTVLGGERHVALDCRKQVTCEKMAMTSDDFV
jgi:hypothetical protein